MKTTPTTNTITKSPKSAIPNPMHQNNNKNTQITAYTEPKLPQKFTIYPQTKHQTQFQRQKFQEKIVNLSWGTLGRCTLELSLLVLEAVQRVPIGVVVVVVAAQAIIHG